MPQRMSASPSCHRQVLLRFLNSFFPGTPVFVPRFSGNFRNFFRRTLTDRPTTNFAHRVYQQIFWNPAEDSAKISPFSSSPRRQSRQPTLRTRYIWKQTRELAVLPQKIRVFFANTHGIRPNCITCTHGISAKKSTIRQRFSKKIVTFHADDRSAADFAHRVYLGTKAKSGRDSQKNLHFFVASAVRDRFRTSGI